MLHKCDNIFLTENKQKEEIADDSRFSIHLSDLLVNHHDWWFKNHRVGIQV